MHIIIYFLTKISTFFFIPSELREEQNFIRGNLPNIFYLKNHVVYWIFLKRETCNTSCIQYKTHFFEKPSRGNSAQDRKFFARHLAALTQCLARLAQDVLLNATSIARLTIDVVFNTQGVLLKISQWILFFLK